MAFKFNPNQAVNPMEAFEANDITATITSAKPHTPQGQSEATSFAVAFKVVEPEQFKGKIFTQFFSFKTDQLWRLTAFLKACNMIGDGADEDFEIVDGENQSFIGRQVVGNVKKVENEYQGQKRYQSQWASWQTADAIDTVDSL